MRFCLTLMLALLLTIVTMPSLAADQWLCIGEYGAEVRKDLEQVIDSSAYQTSLKLLVDEKGVRTFGEDEYTIETCIPQKNGGMLCRDGNEYFHFIMLPTKIFRFVGVGIDETGHIIHMLVMGTCSKISD